jgi:hypothetical protein
LRRISSFSAVQVAHHPHAQAGAGERLAPHDLARQAEGLANPAHLILEKFAQGLDQLELHPLAASRRRCDGS